MSVEQCETVVGRKMGCRPSKQNRKLPIDLDDKKTKQNENSNVEVATVQKYDEIIVNVLFRDLRDEPEMFVLNNILMSVQFFENYHR